jgi:hypothetical protein
MIPIYLILFQAAVPEAAAAPAMPAETVAAPAPAARPAPVLLPHDTPVELMATAEVSTASALPGTVFKLRVNKPISLDGKVIVPVGTPAFGEVIAARDSGGLGKSGRMSAHLLHIQFGEARIPLEGEVQAKGTGAGSAGVAFAISLNPIALFHRGNNAKIKAGEILAGFVSKDVALDLSGATPKLAEKAAPPPAAPVAP